MTVRRERLLLVEKICNGAKTLREAREKAQSFTNYLDHMESRGWVLDGPVYDGCLFLKKQQKDVQNGYNSTSTGDADKST